MSCCTIPSSQPEWRRASDENRIYPRRHPNATDDRKETTTSNYHIHTEGRRKELLVQHTLTTMSSHVLSSSFPKDKEREIQMRPSRKLIAKLPPPFLVLMGLLFSACGTGS